MRFLKRLVLALVLLAIVGGGVMWYLAGREAGPTITIDSPDKFVGRATPLKITVESPTEITAATFYIDQNGKPAPVADMKTDRSDGKLVMSGTIGREGLTNGAATLIVESARKTLYGLRTITSTSRRELTVRLDPQPVGHVQRVQVLVFPEVVQTIAVGIGRRKRGVVRVGVGGKFRGIVVTVASISTRRRRWWHAVPRASCCRPIAATWAAAISC